MVSYSPPLNFPSAVFPLLRRTRILAAVLLAIDIIILTIVIWREMDSYSVLAFIFIAPLIIPTGIVGYHSLKVLRSHTILYSSLNIGSYLVAILYYFLFFGEHYGPFEEIVAAILFLGKIVVFFLAKKILSYSQSVRGS